MLTYTTMKGGVLAVDHFPTLVFGVVIAEDAFHRLHSRLRHLDCSSCRMLGECLWRSMRVVATNIQIAVNVACKQQSWVMVDLLSAAGCV